MRQHAPQQSVDPAMPYLMTTFTRSPPHKHGAMQGNMMDRQHDAQWLPPVLAATSPAAQGVQIQT